MTAHVLTLSIQCAGVLPAHLERDLFLSLPPGSPLRNYADEMADALREARSDCEKAQADAQAAQDEASRMERVCEGLFNALDELHEHASFSDDDGPAWGPAHWSGVLSMIRTLSRWGDDDAEAYVDPQRRAAVIGARLWDELRRGAWEVKP